VFCLAPLSHFIMQSTLFSSTYIIIPTSLQSLKSHSCKCSLSVRASIVVDTATNLRRTWQSHKLVSPRSGMRETLATYTSSSSSKPSTKAWSPWAWFPSTSTSSASTTQYPWAPNVCAIACSLGTLLSIASKLSMI